MAIGSGRKSKERSRRTPYLLYLGNRDAAVTIREYEDFGCHNCRAFAGNVEPELIDEYISTGQVRLVSFPVAFVNSQSLPGAEAAACAAEQDKFNEGFLPYHSGDPENPGMVQIIEGALSGN